MLLDPVLKFGFWANRYAAAVVRRAGMIIATATQRATLGSVGGATRFQWGVRFAQPDIVTVGRGCYFWAGSHASADFPGARLLIGDGVQINRDVHLDTTGGLTLGSQTLISEGAVIYTHDHGLDPRSVPVGIAKVIEDDVWIGMRAVILPKCRHIGRGAIIGACSVVVGDVPAGAIVAGNPARIVGYNSKECSVT